MGESVTRTALILAAAATACDIQEVTLTSPDDVVIAEVYVDVDGRNIEATAFLHRTLGAGLDGNAVPGARVFLRSGSSTVFFLEADPSQCLIGEVPAVLVGTCYISGPLQPQFYGPGERVETIIILPDNRRLTGTTRVPGDFAIRHPEPFPRGERFCSLPPLTRMPVEWSRSEGSWAYISETLIQNLTAALEDTTIEVDQDPLLLLGLSVSESDTTIVFPSEFGLFDRLDLNRDLALFLQQGLPFGTQASVIVSAVDRNYVNWVRGGNFNPSGEVRIPSIHGDGTGVIGSIVRRRVDVDVGLEIPTPQACNSL